LLAGDRVRDELKARNKSIELFGSILVERILDKNNHPLQHGFDLHTALAVNDSTREELAWRTVVEFGVAQLADIFLSTWSSNHPRMAYEMSTALSDARATTPFIGLDMLEARGPEETTIYISSDPSKLGNITGCTYYGKRL
jgi:hypothetical protein